MDDVRSISVTMLQTLVDVVDRGSIVAAARMLHLSQSTTSTHVSILAKIAGGPLLARREGKLVPTRLGSIVYESGNDILGRVADLRARLRREARASERALTLGVSYAACEATLARVLAGFESFAPELRVTVEVESAADTQRHLEAGSVDAVLVEDPPVVRDSHFVPYFRSSVRLAMHPAHELAGRERLTIAELAAYRVVSLKRFAPTRRFVERAIGERVPGPHADLELESSEALVACIEAGVGIGFVTDAALVRPLALGTVVARELEGMPLARTFAIGYRTDRDLSIATRRFVAWLGTTIES